MVYKLGNDSALVIKSFQEKKNIINFLFNNIDLNNFRFQILNNISNLEFLKNNEHFVSPNFKGINYLLVFARINDVNRTFLIDRRKLRYNKDQIDLKTVLILEVNFKAKETLYQGTIIDGKMLKLVNNNYVFICNDCFLLFNNKLDTQKLDIKYQTLDKVISTQIDKKPCPNFDLKINKLYNYDELEHLIKNIIPNSSLPINGLVFFPQYSGNLIIYPESNKNSTNSHSKSNQEIFTKPVTNFKDTKIKDDETFHIISDLPRYLKSRVLIESKDYLEMKQKKLSLKKSDIPDVYHLFEDINRPTLGIAHIPNMATSHKLKELFKNNSLLKLNCYYNKQFKKWVPVFN